MAKKSIGTAYVQIKPTTEGISSGINNLLQKDVAQTGKKMGKGLISNLMGALSSIGLTPAILSGAAIGGAIMKGLKSSLSEGAKLEQSIGGIKTLFGDEDAKQVMENAKKAYHTVGISANEYMEQTTRFSAALLQSLSGDTKKAAEVADMALRDMADNSNKFGVPIDRIQSAYQGFAKQNYTMLDNLSLGYGGTKKEMERLLADAGKFANTTYDISNLNDVYQAIHVIQEQMHITGTTALESATTFTGAFNSMKSSIANMFGNLALGNDISEDLNAIGTTAYTFFVSNMLPMLKNICKSVFNTVVTLFNNAPEILSTVFQGILDFFTNGGALNILNSLLTLLRGIVDKCIEFFTGGGIGDLFQGLMSALTVAFNFIFSDGFQEFFFGMLTAGIDLVLALIGGIIQSIPTIISTIWTFMQNILTTIISNFPQIFMSGVNLILHLINGLLSLGGQLLEVFWGYVEDIWKIITETDWIQLGVDIIQGLINGIVSMATALWDSLCETVSGAVDGVKSFFGIHSPSRLFHYFGEMVVEGFVNALDDGKNSVAKTMQNTFNTPFDDLTTDYSLNVQRNFASDFLNNAQNSAINNGALGGYQQTLNIYAPQELTPYEISRQTKNATKDLLWALKGV